MNELRDQLSRFAMQKMHMLVPDAQVEGLQQIIKQPRTVAFGTLLQILVLLRRDPAAADRAGALFPSGSLWECFSAVASSLSARCAG